MSDGLREVHESIVKTVEAGRDLLATITTLGMDIDETDAEKGKRLVEDVHSFQKLLNRNLARFEDHEKTFAKADINPPAQSTCWHRDAINDCQVVLCGLSLWAFGELRDTPATPEEWVESLDAIVSKTATECDASGHAIIKIPTRCLDPEIAGSLPEMLRPIGDDDTEFYSLVPTDITPLIAKLQREFWAADGEDCPLDPATFAFVEEQVVGNTQFRRQFIPSDYYSPQGISGDTSTDSIISYHGQQNYSCGGSRPFRVEEREDRVLQCFIKGLALSKADLVNATDIEKPEEILKKLCDKYDGVFADAICLPGGKSGGGYFVRVVDQSGKSIL